MVITDMKFVYGQYIGFFLYCTKRSQCIGLVCIKLSVRVEACYIFVIEMPGSTNNNWFNRYDLKS